MKNTLLCLGVAALTIGANTTQAATTAMTKTNTAGSTNPSGWFAGFQFTVTSTIYVTDLGVFDIENDGLSVASDVALYNADTGARLATVSVPTTAAFETTSVFRTYFASIAEVELTTGVNYLVAATMPDLIAFSGAETYESEVSLVSGKADDSETLLASAASGAALLGNFEQSHPSNFGGANFKYSTTPSAVPEPSSTVLLDSAASGAALLGKLEQSTSSNFDEANFKDSTTPSAVPEPSSTVLLSLGEITLILRPRK